MLGANRRNVRKMRMDHRGRIEITPVATPLEGEVGMLSEPELARLEQELISFMSSYLREQLSTLVPKLRTDTLPEAVRAFLALYPKRPVRDNKGGSGFNDCCWIFVLARLIMPSLMVESGVFKGQSSWFMRQAAGPEAKMHCFDVDLSQRIWRDPAVRYHDGDFADCDLHFDPNGNHLAFFDDHISHADRIVQAHARGLRLLLLDDNFQAHQLHSTGAPPVPTLAMMSDEFLTDDAAITWHRRGKRYSFRFSRAEADRCLAVVEGSRVLGDLWPVTGFSPGSRLTLVRLRDAPAGRERSVQAGGQRTRGT